MPDYSYLYKFPGGTPTLDSKKFTEDSRQFDASLRETQEKRKAEALQAARDRMDANKQWAADYALKRQETDYLTSKPYYDADGGGRGSGLYSATVNEMLNGQTRHQTALNRGENRAPHNYNSYISQAIGLSQLTGNPLSAEEIQNLQAQAQKLYDQDDKYGGNGDVGAKKKDLLKQILGIIGE